MPQTSTTPARVFRGVIRRRVLVIGMAVLCAGGAGLLALFTAPRYRSESVVTYDPPNLNQGQLSGALSGIASLVSLGSGTSDARAAALSVLASRELSIRFIQDNKLLPALFPERWDAHQNKWIKPEGRAPTDEEAFTRFNTSVRTVKDDRSNGVIRVSISLGDRSLTAAVANGLVAAADQQLRSRAIADSDSSLALLQKEMTESQATDLRSAIARLMEAELQKATLSRSRERFAFQNLDRAVTPDKPDWPKPTLMIALGAAFGLMVGATLAALLEIRRIELSH